MLLFPFIYIVTFFSSIGVFMWIDESSHLSPLGRSRRCSLTYPAQIEFKLGNMDYLTYIREEKEQILQLIQKN